MEHGSRITNNEAEYLSLQGALEALAQLTAAYMLSEPVARRYRTSMGWLEGFT